MNDLRTATVEGAAAFEQGRSNRGADVPSASDLAREAEPLPTTVDYSTLTPPPFL